MPSVIGELYARPRKSALIAMPALASAKSGTMT
jgi:hypothetical protein